MGETYFNTIPEETVNLTGLQTITGSKTFMSGSATSVPLTVQGSAGQTANLTEWRDQVGTILAQVEANGRVHIPGTMFLHSATSSATAGTSMQVFTTAAARSGLIVRGFASQTANLQEWQNSGGSVTAQVNSVGGARFGIGGTGNYGSSFGVVDDGLDAVVRIQPSGVSTRALIIRGAAGQTGNLQEWQNSAGTIQCSVGPTGRIELGLNWIASPAGLAGGSAPALPANPLGYALFLANNGVKIAVPYYTTTS